MKNQENKVREIDLEKTDFLENAKFMSVLVNGYFLLGKRCFFNCHFFSAALTVFFFLEWKDPSLSAHTDELSLAWKNS